jgi:hypothetical protein
MYGGQLPSGGLTAGPADRRSVRCQAIRVPMTTPATYPANATAVCAASEVDPRASDRPNNVMFPVITLVNTFPSRVKLATSDAPDANVRTMATTVITRAGGAVWAAFTRHRVRVARFRPVDEPFRVITRLRCVG